MDSTLVRQLIRHRLLEGRLPRGRAVDIWDAPGEGQTCDGCDDPIARDQMMIWGIASQDWVSVHFHATCYELWEAERLALSRKDGGGPT